MTAEQEQVKRIREKTLALLLTGRFGMASGFTAQDFRIDVAAYGLGVYGDGNDKLRRITASAIGRSFMKSVCESRQQNLEDAGMILLGGLNDAEQLLDELAR